MFAAIEEFNRRIWGDKVTLATTAHAIGGLGIGLLICRGDQNSRIGGILLTLSGLAHLYAFLTKRPGTEVAHQA